VVYPEAPLTLRSPCACPQAITFPAGAEESNMFREAVREDLRLDPLRQLAPAPTQGPSAPCACCSSTATQRARGPGSRRSPRERGRAARAPQTMNFKVPPSPCPSCFSSLSVHTPGGRCVLGALARLCVTTGALKGGDPYVLWVTLGFVCALGFGGWRWGGGLEQVNVLDLST